VIQTHRLAILGFVLALGMQLAAQAPAPPLAVAASPVPDSQGFTEILATNVYTSPATEYEVRVSYWLAGGRPCSPAHHSADGRCWGALTRLAIMTPGTRGGRPGRWLILPKESVRVPGPGPQASAIRAVECIGVLYDNGAAAGEPYILQKMKLQRRHNLEDARAQLQMLEQLAAPDLAQLAALFAANATQHRAEIAGLLTPASLPDRFGPGYDQVCVSLGAQMRQAIEGKVSAPRAISGSIRFLKAYIAMMESAKVESGF